MRRLISSGAPINLIHAKSTLEAPLLVAIKHGNYRTAEALIRAGADLDSCVRIPLIGIPDDATQVISHRAYHARYPTNYSESSIFSGSSPKAFGILSHTAMH